VSERAARIVLWALTLGLGAAALCVDLPALSSGQFWGDGATYWSMAFSIAEDHDLRYEAKDLLRARREFGSGPEGILLKRASGGLVLDSGLPFLRRLLFDPQQHKDERRIYFAKAFVYPALAAPLVGLFKTRGLLLTNALCMGLSLLLFYGELRQQTTPARALWASLALLLGTVTPLYILWLTPEIFSLALSAAALVAWRRGKHALAAILIGILTYTKPYNLLLALPLLLDPFLVSLGSELPSLKERLLVPMRRSFTRGLIVVLTAVVLFGLNTAITGEWNYQGGERKTFNGVFPFEPGKTFGNCGTWMTTDRLGPLVKGVDEHPPPGSAPPRSRLELWQAFLWNLLYFWVGRFAGALTYFFPAVLALVLFVLVGPRSRAGWLAVVTLLVSQVFYIWNIPDNWYGGGGTVGNRYFLNLLPLAIFFVPRGKEVAVALGGLLGLVVLAPIFRSPVDHSLHAGAHATHRPFVYLPAELTMLNDLSVFTDPWRKKQAFGDIEGDPHKGYPPDPKAYWLYFLDDGTFGKEKAGGVEGFWLRGGEHSEVILRSLWPVRRMRFELGGGPGGDRVGIRLGNASETLLVPDHRERELVLDAPQGFPFYGSFVYIVRLSSALGAREPDSADVRLLGGFVHISLEIEKRPS